MGIEPVVLAGVLVLLALQLTHVGQRTLRQVDETAADAATMVAGEPVANPPLLAEVEATGFVPVASLRDAGDLRIVRALALDPDSVIFELVWSEHPAAPPAMAAFCSVLAGGRWALMTQTTGHIPAAHGVLRQVFPGAGVAALLRHHREALSWLERKGIRRSGVPTGGAAVEAYRSWVLREAQAVRGARWPVGLAIWWRMRRGRHLDVGPIATQPGIDARLPESPHVDR